jgi:hydrogenase maturation protease
VAGLLIIGWGNPLRGDDGFGFVAAERLQERLRETGVEVLALHQLAPELMEPIAQAERVVFIDASADGEPGQLVSRDLLPSTHEEAFTHHASPAGLLAGAQWLYGKAPEAVLYTVRGESFAFGEGLSRGVRAAVAQVVKAIAG